MANENEADGTRPRIEKAEDFAKWLDQPRATDVCAALVVRAALRVLTSVIEPVPYFLTTVYQEYIEKTNYVILRATAAALFFLKHPRTMPTEATISLKLAAYIDQAYTDASLAASNPDQSTLILIRPAAEAAKMAFSLHRSASNARNTLGPPDSNSPQQVDTDSKKATFRAVNEAANGIISTVKARPESDDYNIIQRGRVNEVFDDLAERSPREAIEYLKTEISSEFWRAVDEDIRLISSGATARDLIGKPLWPPGPLLQYFISLSGNAALSSSKSDNAWVWKNWYKDILDGRAHSGEYDKIYATVPIEEWDKGPVAANAWIAERLAELDKKNSTLDQNLRDFPKPVENVPSLFTFGLNDSGQIDVVAGPQNTPVIGFAGDETTHRQWLETARELARRLAEELRDNKFGNVRRDYADGLLRYAGDLPSEIGEGNFLLADHEIIAIHDLFGAEAAILPEALAAKLNGVLRAHYALLDFYPETKRYHEAAQKGRLGPPAPEKAFADFEKVVQEFTPEIFAPRITQEIKAVNYEAPRVEIDEEDRKLHAAIEPARYPYEHDRLQERRYSFASLANALSKPLWNLAKDPEKAIAYGLLLDKLSPSLVVIKQHLLALINN